MKYTVPDEVLKATTKCEHDFTCLESGQCGQKPMCEVGERDGKNVLFLKTKEAALCAYRIDFAGGQVCTCPTHYAIEMRYGK